MCRCILACKSATIVCLPYHGQSSHTVYHKPALHLTSGIALQRQDVEATEHQSPYKNLPAAKQRDVENIPENNAEIILKILLTYFSFQKRIRNLRISLV